MLTSSILAFLSGKGLSLKEWKVSAQALSSILGADPQNFASCELRETSYQGVTDGTLLWSRRAKGLHSGPVFRVA